MPSQHRICTHCEEGYMPSINSHRNWCLYCAGTNDAGRANRLAALKSKRECDEVEAGESMAESVGVP